MSQGTSVIVDSNLIMLAWRLHDRLSPGSSVKVLLHAARNFVADVLPPTLFADRGGENVTAKVDALINSGLLKHVTTDASNIYSGIESLGMTHRVDSTAHGVPQEDVLPTLHLAFANLKTWLQGTFHGAVRKEHLQAYLNEFAFRFNRRKNLHAAFLTLLGIAPRVEGPTYRSLYGGTFAHPNPRRR